MKNDEMTAKMWSMARLATPMAIRVAATLRLADHVAAGRNTGAELAAATDTDPDAVERLMRYLAVRKMFDRDDQGRYTLTPLGDTLREDHHARLRPRLDVERSLGRAELSFAHLLHSIRTGEASFHLQFGRTFFEDWAADPERAEDFCQLTSDMESQSPDLVAGYDWETLGTIVDVGGGNGALMLAVLQKHSGLRATIVEQPDNADPARKTIAENDMHDRMDVVARSFFEPLPAGAGGYVMSFVVHNWGDGPALELLRNCAKAAGADGKVLVIEKTGPEGMATHTGMDLRMLVVTGGKERTTDEMAELAAKAGLRITGVFAAGAFSIIELGAAQ